MSEKELIKARLLVAQADLKKKQKKAPKAAKKSQGKENKPKSKAAAPEKKKRKAPTVRWAKEDTYHLTDELLTIIESKARYKQAFGFDKGQKGPVDTGGKKLPDLCGDIATALFRVGDEDSTYTSDDLSDLATVVKNRVATLKKAYQAHHEKLGATGHGLIAAGNEADIIPDSEIANAWEEISKKFPWYRRMDVLMGTSPIVNRSAVAHSQTRVDLGVLDREGTAHNGPISVKDGDTDDEQVSGWEGYSPAAAVDDGDDDDDSDKLTISSSSPVRPAPITPKAKNTPASSAAPSSSARGAKRKSIHDHLESLAAQDREQRMKMAETKEKERTRRSQAKYDAQHKLEEAHLRHSEREAARQREHEERMMDRQMQLEAIRQGTLIYGPGGPANGAPPPQFIDPALHQ